jgi:hypothetical protein
MNGCDHLKLIPSCLIGVLALKCHKTCSGKVSVLVTLDIYVTFVFGTKHLCHIYFHINWQHISFMEEICLEIKCY